MQITKNFTMKELIYSPTAQREGINNTPTDEHMKNLLIMAVNLLQPARTELGHAIHINSGYRSLALNNAIPSASKTSDHMNGMAADVICYDNLKLWNILKKLDFKQLIWYYEDDEKPTFIHVSYDKDNLKKQVLYCYLSKGNDGVYRRKYKPFK